MPDSHPRNQRMIYRAVFVIWLVLLLTVTSSIVALDLQRAATNFNENFNLHYQQASDKVHVIESILEGFAAMVSVTNDPGRERIRVYAQKILEGYPQIFMFEIVEKVPHDKLAAFTEYYRRTMYTDFRVKGFSYESDRQWQPVGVTPYHMPIVFMEPFPEQSRKVLGLDLGSNDFFVRALQESERLNRSLSTEPFTLIEGDLAYVIHQPVLWFDKPMPSYSYDSGADSEFAVLVVRAGSLLDRESHPYPGMREVLYHPNYSETDPRGYLHLHESPATSRLESMIFPRLHASMALGSASQPFILVAGHQLGWAVITWWKLAVTGLIAIFTFMVMMVYARLYFRNELSRAEENAQRQQRDMVHMMRLGTMGEMATGIAHELNQPLTALVSYCGTAQALVKALPAPPRQLSEILARAMEQAHRAGDIIRHLREFVSKEERKIETLDLDQVVQGVIKFLKWEVQQSGVTIQFLPGGQGRKIKAGKVQIEQVLINLLRNSLEAIVHDNISAGEIVIQTRLSATDMIELTVADNGPGIAASIVDRLFEQFQTSKKTGMGIGLSLSRTIIETHGGKLWVDKNYRNGALFGFVLPVSG